MRRSLISVLTLALAACSAGTVTTTTTTTTTTSDPFATTTTRAPQLLVPGGLIAVDPATLVPYEDAEPIIVGTSHHGTVSSNGTWVAVASASEDGDVVIVITGDDRDVVSQTPGSGEGLYVDDEGLAVWFDEGRLRSSATDAPWQDLELPGPVPPALTDSLEVFADGRIAYAISPDDGPGPISLVLVNEASHSELVIQGVDAGPLSVSDLPVPDFLAPAVVWDPARNRAILVSATANEVAVVDLGSGETVIHHFDADALPDWGVGRDAFLTTDSETLLIATRVLELAGGEADWEAHEYAGDLVLVDTADWATTETTQSIWTLSPSRDATSVAGTGASVTWSQSGDAETLQSPVYLIDGTDGEVLVGFEGRSGTIDEVQFSGDGAEMYVMSESEDGTNIDIIDVATQQLAGSLGFNRISLIGGAGLMAFHLD